MPLTLVEINSLITALGVKIPPEILEQKAKAEAFKKRREKLAAEAGGKPADWWLSATFKDTLARAETSAGQKQYDPAFALLDEAATVLLQPDTPPAPPALTVWRDAKDAVDAQLNQLYAKLKSIGIPVLEKAANDIEAVLEKYRTKLIVALTAYDNATGGAKDKARAQALQVVGTYQTGIQQDKHILAADTNPFGVPVTIRETLGAALAALNKQLGSA